MELIGLRKTNHTLYHITKGSTDIFKLFNLYLLDIIKDFVDHKLIVLYHDEGY